MKDIIEAYRSIAEATRHLTKSQIWPDDDLSHVALALLDLLKYLDQKYPGVFIYI